MLTVETYADLPRKLGYHAFIVLALIQAADMMGERPVTAQWIYDRAPGFGKGKITDSLRLLTSPENQYAIKVTGGWQLNRDEAFQLPLGYELVEGENRSGDDSQAEIIDGDARSLVNENHPGNDFTDKNRSGSDSCLDIIDLEAKNEPELVDENRPGNDSCIKDGPQNRPGNDSQTRIGNFCEVLKTPSTESLNTVVVEVNNLNLTTTTDSDSSAKSEKTWEDENRLLLKNSHLLFGEPGVRMDLELNTIPPQIVRGWLNQCYFGLTKNHFDKGPAGAAGTVYNRLRDYVTKPDPEKPRATFLHADPSAYLPDDYLVAIGVKRKTCERCQAGFGDLAAYEAHLEQCTWTEPPEEPEPAPLVPDETITDKVRAVWGSVLETIRADMPKASFETWVQGAQPVRVHERHMLIAVRNSYARDWLALRMTNRFQQLLGGMTVEFVVSHGIGD